MIQLQADCFPSMVSSSSPSSASSFGWYRPASRGRLVLPLILPGWSTAVFISYTSAMKIAWVLSLSSSLCSGSSYSSCSSASSSSASSFTTSSCVHSFVPSILFPAGGAVDLCLWAQQTWRLSSSCVGCFPRVGMHPSAQPAGPP